MNNIGIMRKTSAGFTMFELLIIIGVISVVTLAAVPQLTKARETYRLTGTANDLVGRLNNARIMAITRSADHRVAVTSTTTYALQKETAPNTWTAVESFTLRSGYTISATNSGEFHNRGNANPAGTFTITNSYSQTRQVSIDPSGRVYATQ